MAVPVQGPGRAGWRGWHDGAAATALSVVMFLVALSQAMAQEALVSSAETCFRPRPYPDHRRYESYDCGPSLTSAAAMTAMQNAAGATTGLVFNSVCADDATCDQLKPALDHVKAAIENAIVLDTPVYVSMTFVSFCKEAQNGQLAIDADCRFVLGAASPYQVPLQDDDGIQRMYPKALARQWGYASDGDPDIYAYFNSDARWFYPQDTNSTLEQEDIVFVIAHELLHGLGFLSEWSSDGETLCPMVRTDVDIVPSLTAKDKPQPSTFVGFTESAFDRLIGTTDTLGGSRLFLTDVTKQWIAAGAPVSGQPIEIASAALGSNSTLARIGYELKLLAEKSGTLSLVDPKTQEPFLLLDTSLMPFIRGTSLTHVSQAKYKTSIDALMVPTTRGGFETTPTSEMTPNPLNSHDWRPSGSNYTFSGRVTLPHDRLVGPEIARVLSLIGYKTAANSNPSNKPSLPSRTGTTSQKNSAAARFSTGVSLRLVDSWRGQWRCFHGDFQATVVCILLAIYYNV